MKNGKNKKSGVLIGKFLPPHLGHQYLIDFAKNYVDDLTVLVCTLKSEPIPGILRHQWLKEMFPNVRVLHVRDENPQYPNEHPDFWNIWKNTIKKALPQKVDYLFASEDYGFKLAKIIGAKYIPVNHSRSMVPICATKIRENPYKYWEFIPPVVRPYFLKRVCIFGPESTGKSVLTKKLAKHFNTKYCEEYARGLLDFTNGKVVYSDISKIVKGHKASEEALSRQANKILFSDTDIITTTIWSNALFGKCPRWIINKSMKTNYDLYLLSDIDVPFVKDNQRYLPNKRKWFFNLCVKELEKRRCNYRVISGNWDQRLQKAIKAVDELFL